MAHNAAAGRHRAPGRYNPLSELGLVIGRSTQPVVKGSAVLAASGGLVAAFALPANATGDTTAHPALTKAATPARTALPAVTAPAAVAPAAATFGVSEVRAVAKPKPKPKPRPVATTTVLAGRATTAVSRSSTRHAVSTKSSSNRSYSSSKPAAGGVLGIAASLSGIYYVYGGSTPAGFDCSGFTQYVYAHAGISIPRTATAQMNAATIVSNPQPGDLVFTVSGGIATHVGIYTGPGMMIDSPRTGKATSERAIFSGNVYGRF